MSLEEEGKARVANIKKKAEQRLHDSVYNEIIRILWSFSPLVHHVVALSSNSRVSLRHYLYAGLGRWPAGSFFSETLADLVLGDPEVHCHTREVDADALLSTVFKTWKAKIENKLDDVTAKVKSSSSSSSPFVIAYVSSQCSGSKSNDWSFTVTFHVFRGVPDSSFKDAKGNTLSHQVLTATKESLALHAEEKAKANLAKALNEAKAARASYDEDVARLKAIENSEIFRSPHIKIPTKVKERIELMKAQLPMEIVQRVFIAALQKEQVRRIRLDYERSFVVSEMLSELHKRLILPGAVFYLSMTADIMSTTASVSRSSVEGSTVLRFNTAPDKLGDASDRIESLYKVFKSFHPDAVVLVQCCLDWEHAGLEYPLVCEFAAVSTQKKTTKKPQVAAAALDTKAVEKECEELYANAEKNYKIVKANKQKAMESAATKEAQKDFEKYMKKQQQQQNVKTAAAAK